MPVRLNDSQIRAYVDAFDQADRNEDGLISRSELLKLLQDLNLARTQEEMTEALKTLSLNNDYITRANLLHIAKQLLETQKNKSIPQSPTLSTLDRKKLTEKVSGWFSGESSADPTGPMPGSFFASTVQRPSKVITTTNDKVVVKVDPPDEIEDYEYYSYSSEDDDDEANLSKPAVAADRRASKSTSIKSKDDEQNRLMTEKQKQEEKAKRVSEIGHRGKRPIQGDGLQSAGTTAAGAAGPVKYKSPLLDPRVRKQMVAMKEHLPYFIYFVSVIQTLLFAYSLYHNGGFENMSVNPFGGPSSLTIIQLGAKYVPCMKPDPTVQTDFFMPCNPKYPKNGVKSLNGTCLYYDNLAFICGMGGFSQRDKPDQIWRFITAIFMHTGLIHLALNMMLQIYVAVPMERNMGPLRFAMVYMISGVAGNMVTALVQPKKVAVGSSGALFGLFALLMLDLIHNWPILTSPIKDAIMLAFKIIVAFCVGLLPYIDNFAHIGGFIAGIFAGLIFMRSIEFSDWDRRRRRLLMLLAVPVLIAGIVLGFYLFWTRLGVECAWCQYLDCIPVGSPWCTASP